MSKKNKKIDFSVIKLVGGHTLARFGNKCFLRSDKPCSYKRMCALLDSNVGNNSEKLKKLKTMGINDITDKALKDFGLTLACRYNLNEVARELLKVGADVNSNGYMSLYQACLNNNIVMVKLLLKNRARIVGPEGWFQSALVTAVIHSGLRVVEELLKHEIEQDSKQEALELAILFDKNDMAKAIRRSIKQGVTV